RRPAPSRGRRCTRCTGPGPSGGCRPTAPPLSASSATVLSTRPCLLRLPPLTTGRRPGGYEPRTTGKLLPHQHRPRLLLREEGVEDVAPANLGAWPAQVAEHPRLVAAGFLQRVRQDCQPVRVQRPGRDVPDVVRSSGKRGDGGSAPGSSCGHG